jgi:hypothetical protein
MAGFSDQLYVQGAVMIDLLYRVMQDMIMYHCQRFPKELAEFHWVVDAKDSAVVTDWEDWWSKTLVIWLQAMSLERPGAMLPGGDYRHFRRFILAELPAYLRDVAPPGDRTHGAWRRSPIDVWRELPVFEPVRTRSRIGRYRHQCFAARAGRELG